MSTRAVIGWLLVAVALGVAAIVVLLLRPPATGPGSAGASGGAVAVGDRLMEFVPGDVRQIIVQQHGGPRQIVERTPGGKGPLGADAEWQLRIEPAPDDKTPPPPVWPLDPTKVQGLIRVLAEAKAVAVPSGSADLGDHPTKVELVFGDATCTWLLSDRTLAGTGMIRVEAFRKAPARQAVVREQLIQVFTDPGPRAWRDRFPLAGIAADASRVRLVNMSQKLLLAKLEGKWSLREPVGAPADPAAVKELLTELGRTGIVDFLDSGGPPSDATLEHPTATIVIEADRRVVEPGKSEPRVTTDSLTLSIGGAAGPGRVYAKVGDSRKVVLEGKTLTFAANPAAYVWPHPLREAPANIGVLAIKLIDPTPGMPEPRSFRRSGGKWVQLMESGADGALSEREQRDVDSLVAFLTGETEGSAPNAPPPAAGEVSLTAPEGARPICAMQIGSLAGSPLETVEVDQMNGDKLALKTGPVYRTYTAGQLPIFLKTLPRAPEPEPASAGGSQAAPTR
jgi:hypothetical protein